MNVDWLIGFVQFVVALVSLILVHELGHFIASRLFKVEVEEFGIGFPPRLVTLFKAGGTIFSLNAIPLGGFVRPKGENDPGVEGGLAAAKPWVRLGVLSAGSIMNLLTGVVLFAIIFAQVGSVLVYNKVEIVDVADGSPAQSAGLQSGDIVVSMNDRKITSTDVLKKITYKNLDRPISMVYQRGGQNFTTSLTPRSNPPKNQGAMGILMGNPTAPATWYNLLPASGMAVYYHAKMLLELPIRLIQGSASPEEGRLVGLKGMFDIYQQVRKTETVGGIPGFVNIIYFFTSVTVSLGLLNLLPIPAMDGGRIIFVLPELILRRRVPAEYENIIHLVGFGLLIMFFIYINLKDFINPVVIPGLPYP